MSLADITSREGRTGTQAVLAAARLCQAVRREMVEELPLEGPMIGHTMAGQIPLEKSDLSPVTVADFGSQAVVSAILAQQFPDDALIAEEDSQVLRTEGGADVLNAVVRFVAPETRGLQSLDHTFDLTLDASTVCAWIDRGQSQPQHRSGARFWVLDPIDGTKGFLRNDQYAVALALIEGGHVQWGFLGCPALSHQADTAPSTGTGVLFVAQRGQGTQAYTLDEKEIGPVAVSQVTTPALARLAESVESAHTNRGLSAQLQQMLGMSGDVVQMDSQAKYAAVARGQAEVYLRSPNPRTPDYRECIWDHAAGWLVVEEAGGKVTDVYGRSLDWTHGRRLEQNIGVVASNGILHATVLKALASLLPPLS